jgi:hypothetical protein
LDLIRPTLRFSGHRDLAAGPASGRSRFAPLDGLADFVFWGKDAPAIAEKFQASRLDDRQFGWVNVPDGEVYRFSKPFGCTPNTTPSTLTAARASIAASIQTGMKS